MRLGDILGQQEQTYTDSAVVDLWKGFLESYKEGRSLNFYYLDKLANLRRDQKKLLILDYDHLTDHKYQGDQDIGYLRFLTHHDPDTAKKTLREASLMKLKESQSEYAQEIDKEYHVEFANAHLEKEIPDLMVSDCGKLLKVVGKMTLMDDVSSAKTYYTAWRCQFNHLTKAQGTKMPTKCKGAAIVSIVEGEGEEGAKEFEGCDSITFTKDEKQSYQEDYIRFDIQQRSEKTLESKSPATIGVEVVGRDSVEWARKNLTFNQSIALTCVPRTRPSRVTSGQGNAIQDIYLDSSTIEVYPERYFDEDPDPTLDDIVQDTVRHDIDPKKNRQLEAEGLEKLIDSICPSLYMSNKLLKELVLMWLVGSDPFISPDGKRVRGEVQLFILGDPGMGKSEIADYVRKARNRILYNSGGKSSTVGLVGGLIYDKDGVARISPGVFGLAKEGGVILDEFAERTPREYQDLLEPLSDLQTVTIAKGDHFKQTRVNTAVLAIANPSTVSRYYNSKKSLYENTQIPMTVIQRFDLVLIIQDVVDKEEDRKKIKHFFEAQKYAVREEEFYKQRPDKFKRRNENYYSLDYMKRYISYARANFHPKCVDSPDATDVIENWYAKARFMKITINEEGSKGSEKDVTTISAADMRKAGAVERLAQCHARALLRNYVTREDAERACFYMDITLAEAGWWRQGVDGNKEYEKDSLTEYRKKQQGEWEIRFRKKFDKELQKFAFIKCHECRGEGEKIEIGGESLRCQNCQAVGANPCIFSKIDMNVDCVGNEGDRITQKAFNKFWDELEAKYLIVPSDSNPGYFKYLGMWDKGIPKSKQSAKDDLRDRTKRNHPGVWRRFNRDSSMEDLR